MSTVAVDVQWTALNGVPCRVRRVPGGALCGYVQIPDGWSIPDGLSVHGGITGGFDDWIGFDVAHGGDFDPVRDASLPADLIKGLRRWTVDDARAETERLAAQVAPPTPWKEERPGLLVLRDDGGALATLQVVRTARTARVAWTHRPKKCAYQYAIDAAAGAAALSDRSLPEIPAWLVARVQL